MSANAPDRTDTLRLLLQVAAGYLYFGQEDRARPILDEARDLLLKGDAAPVKQTALASAYATTLSQAPVEPAIARLIEMFRKLQRVHDSYTPHTHYSLSRLDFIEAVVLAVVSDDFTLDQAGRRWLDDDEFLVRRRIHRDVKEVVG